MRGTGRVISISALVLCALGGVAAAGCTAEGNLQIGTPEPPPPPPPPAPADDDGDGIPNDADKCPAEAEDGKPPDPSDGCPNKDEDGDGIPVPTDKCPTEPETVNGFEDDDGCPDKKPIVQLVGQKVQINQKILFEKGKSKIKPESQNVVDAVAKVLKDRPEIGLVEVAGHASKEGDAFFNRTLTQKRVDAVVKALVTAGVEKSRLVAQGYGFYCPTKEGDSEADLEANRRVEFTIMHRDGKETGEKRGCDAAAAKKIIPKKLPKPKPVPEKKIEKTPTAGKTPTTGPAKKAPAGAAAAPTKMKSPKK